MTTDASCLENIHAQAILELQAGFRFGFAPCLPGKSYQDSIIFSIMNHSKSLFSHFNVHDTDIQPWRRELILEIRTRLNEHEGGLESKPLTGWVDFASATNAFSRWNKSLVSTRRVDKAANCLCVMCKTCYVQLATDKMEGPGYSRMEGVDLASIKSTIIKRQSDFLRQEHLTIPLVRKHSDEDLPATILVPTDRLPVRYITAKLHKDPVATRGITACCGSPMDGIAKIVNACLAALRPVLNALWRDKCVEIGIFSDECWIRLSDAEIIDIVRTSDAVANSFPGPKYYHRFETYDFETMYPNWPDAEVQEMMLKFLESTFKYKSQHGLRSIELRWSYANDHTCPVAREASWSKQPQPITAKSKSHVWVGPDTTFRWFKCVLNEGCVQFSPYIYR